MNPSVADEMKISYVQFGTFYQRGAECVVMDIVFPIIVRA